MRLHDESRWRIYWSLVIFGLVFWGARDVNQIPHFPFIFVIKDISAVSLFRRNWNPKCPALFARSEWKAAESGTRNYISLYRLSFALKFFFFFLIHWFCVFESLNFIHGSGAARSCRIHIPGTDVAEKVGPTHDVKCAKLSALPSYRHLRLFTVWS